VRTAQEFDLSDWTGVRILLGKKKRGWMEVPLCCVRILMRACHMCVGFLIDDLSRRGYTMASVGKWKAERRWLRWEQEQAQEWLSGLSPVCSVPFPVLLLMRRRSAGVIVWVVVRMSCSIPCLATCEKNKRRSGCPGCPPYALFHSLSCYL